ncbi:MAG: AAA family ATPase [Gemmataceae bacterium]|nr:AAA family ATPase [Gemmataceae bacterium]
MSTPKDQLARISGELETARQKIDRFRLSLGRHLVEKQDLIDLLIIGAIAQEPVLLVGPPGTAKSDLVLKLVEGLGLGGDDYFEYMLTRFTEPSEILGPLDLAFLDEIFKSSSAILNVLLTILNERKYYQDGRPEPVPLKLLFAAANEIPEHSELSALRDRFCLKAESRSVRQDHFEELIDSGLRNESLRFRNLTPWKEGLCSLADLELAHQGLLLRFAEESVSHDGGIANDRSRFFPAPVFAEFRRLVETLAREHRIYISDRKLVKIYKLLRARAWLIRGGEVSVEDLMLLSHLGESLRELRLLAEMIPQYLRLNRPDS